MNAIIKNISPEAGAKGLNFVIALQTGTTREYFRVSLSNETSRRIGDNQLRGAFPELTTIGDPIRYLLANRSKYLGKEVEIEVIDQVEKGTNIVRTDKQGRSMHNVRLVPSNRDYSNQELEALFAGQPAAIGSAAAATL